MPSPDAELFRRFTRSVFAMQAVLLKHGDVANARFGHSSARWRVLVQIADGHASVGEIARLTGYARQSVQRLADALAADGLIEQEPDDSDRRKQRLRMTDAGRATFQAMEDHFDVWAARLMTQIREADLEAVTANLDRLHGIVQADCDHMKHTEQ